MNLLASHVIFLKEWKTLVTIQRHIFPLYSCIIPLGIVQMMSLWGQGLVVCTVAKDPKSLSTTAGRHKILKLISWLRNQRKFENKMNLNSQISREGKIKIKNIF